MVPRDHLQVEIKGEEIPPDDAELGRLGKTVQRCQREIEDVRSCHIAFIPALRTPNIIFTPSTSQARSLALN